MRVLERFDLAFVRMTRVLAEAMTLARTALSAGGRSGAAGKSALVEEVERLRIENDILRRRLLRIPPPHRPRYSPFDRFAILCHQARYALSLAEAGRIFAVEPDTIRRWASELRRRADGIVRAAAPLNKLSDLVRAAVHQLKAENLDWGTRKIAAMLAHLGLRGHRRSVQRILREKPPNRRPRRRAHEPQGRPIRAKRPNHVWEIDITKIELRCIATVRIAVVIDLYSRKVMAATLCRRQPTAAMMTALVRKAVRRHGKPRHLISDRGTQFTAGRFIRFLKRLRIGHRYGAVASSQSVAIIERFWRTLKNEAGDALSPWRSLSALRRNLRTYVKWYNRHRPHSSSGGSTPNAAFYGRRKASRNLKRFELVRSLSDAELRLPVYRLRRAA